MRRTAATIGTLAVVGLLAVGCGSSSDEPTDGDDGTTTTSTAEGTTSTTGESMEDMTDAQLSELLLTPTDLGSGWAVDTEPGGGSLAVPSCLKDAEGGDSEADADGSYSNGETAFAFEGLGWQTSQDEAKTAYEAVTSAFDTCQDVTIRQNGQTVAGTITANGDAGVGDASKGYTMSFAGDGEPLGLDVVVAYVDQVDVIVILGTNGEPQPGAIDTIAEAAVDKITSGLPA